MADSQERPASTKPKKVSRERQLKINEASRKCRKKQKLELHYLRQRTKELEAILTEHRSVCNIFPNALSNVSGKFMSSNSAEESDAKHLTLSTARRTELLILSKFIRRSLWSESASFTPDTISCLPIQMNEFQMRLNITEKNFTIHTEKFYACNYKDLFDFCWEKSNSTTVDENNSECLTGEHFCKVYPLDDSTSYIETKTKGKWSFEIHGIPNVSFTSLLCKQSMPDFGLLICQQSVLDDKDFRDSSTIPWLFKRWVVIKPAMRNGTSGALVESFRTASYATGKRIYSQTKRYDSFCEHIIRRYAESNAILERMMALDGRFPNIEASADYVLPSVVEQTSSDRMVTNLLLF